MTATRGAAAILLAIVAGAACAGQPGAGGPAPSAAPATDIYLYELESGGGTGRLRNLTHRRGYDNQPAWDGSDRLLYTSEHGGQTDIYAIRLSSGRIHRVTATPESEYSPTPAPDGGIAVVRVERDSTQRLWRFSPSGDSASVILRDVKPVGYFAWLDANTLALFVLGNPNTLRIADARAGAEWVVASDIGRSLQRVPGTRLGSFLHRSGSRWVLKTVDPARRMDGGQRGLRGVANVVRASHGGRLARAPHAASGRHLGGCGRPRRPGRDRFEPAGAVSGRQAPGFGRPGSLTHAVPVDHA
jgi:hypothetical protein